MNTTFDDIYGGKYLSGAVLGDQTLRVTIGSADVVDLRQKDGSTRRRIVLSFPGQDKQLPLNKTNADALADLCGSKDPAAWTGVSLELFTESTSYGPGIRLRPLRPAAVAKPQPASKKELDDDIPF